MALRSPEGSDEDDSDEYGLSWRAVNTLLRNGHSWSGREMNCAFLNMGGGEFADISHVAGLDSAQDSRGAAMTDWDHDGDVDLWMNYRSGPRVRFMRNNAVPDPSFVAFRLVGTTDNRDCVGARITVKTADRTVLRTLSAANNYMAQSSKWVSIGLAGQPLESVSVRWPDGTTAEYGALQSNTRYELVQGEDRAAVVPSPVVTQRLASSPIEAEEISTAASIPLLTPIALPPISFEDFDGQNHTLGESGRPMLINIWASWCMPCVAELTAFVAERPRWERAGIDLVALSADSSEDMPQARRMADEMSFWFPAGPVPEAMHRLLEVLRPVLVDRFESVPLPTSLLVDAEGRITRVYFGPCDLDQVTTDVARLPASERERLEYISRSEGAWQVPDLVLQNGWWLRTTAMVQQLAERESLSLAAFYGEQLHQRTLVEQPPQAVVETARATLGSLAHDYASENPRRAAEIAQWTVDLDPESAQALLLLADVMIRIGDEDALEEGALAFDEALFQMGEPTEPRQVAAVGQTWMQLHKYERAIPYLRRAVEFNDADLRARANLGLSLILAGRDAEGAPMLAEIIGQLDPSPVNQLTLAKSLDRLGESQRAVLHFKEFIALSDQPTTLAAHYDHGVAKMRVGDAAGAVEHFRVLYEAEPGNTDRQWRYGVALFEAGEAAEAVEHLQAAVSAREPAANDYYQLGAALGSAGKYVESIAAFERALALNGDHVPSLRGLGVALDADGQYDEAAAMYTRYLEHQGNDWTIVDKLSTIHERLSQWEQAMERCRQLVEMKSDHFIARLRLAMMYATAPIADLRNGQEALTLAREVEQAVGSDSPIIQDVLAAAYAELGRFDEAVAAAEKGIQIATEQRNPIADGLRERLELYRNGKPFRRD